MNKSLKAKCKKYGITPDIYKQMLDKSNNTCYICGYTPKDGGRALSIDHDHAIESLKVRSVKESSGWWAWVEEIPLDRINGKTKSKAIQEMKQVLLRQSVRGLVCWKCNSGLKWFRDNSSNLESAALYIRKYQERING